MKKIIEGLKNFRFKGTVLLFLVFIVLLIFVLTFEKKRPTKTGEEVANETFKVWEINSNDVEKLNIKYNNKEVEIAKDGENWKVKKPTEFDAKNEKIKEIIDELIALEGEKKINDQNLADFGLDKPEVESVLTVKGGKTYKLLVGSENPEKTKRYAKVDGADYIFLTDTSLSDTLKTKEDKLKK